LSKVFLVKTPNSSNNRKRQTRGDKTIPVTSSYECANCGEVFSSDIRPCPKCGSNVRKIKVTVEETLTFRTELRGKVKGKSGQVASKFLKRQKLSRHGKEASEELHIDVRGNRKFHHVEEKDKNGTWKTVHHEDEPLKKKRIKQ